MLNRKRITDQSSVEESCTLVKHGGVQQDIQQKKKTSPTCNLKKSYSPSAFSRNNGSVTSTPTSVNTLSTADQSSRISDILPSTPDMPASRPIQSKRVSIINSSAITSPFTCGESFFEGDAPMTQSHVSYISSVNRKSPGTDFTSTSEYIPKGSGLSSPVFNFNKNAATILHYDTSDYNEAVQHSQNEDNFEFGYKISDDVPPMKGSKPVVRDGYKVNTDNFSDDDMFAVDDFDDEFTEEMDLPTITTPSRQRKPGMNTQIRFFYFLIILVHLHYFIHKF